MLKRLVFFLIITVFITSTSVVIFTYKKGIKDYLQMRGVIKQANTILNTVTSTSGNNDQVLISVIKIPANSKTIIEYDKNGKTISDWAGTGNGVVINGGYFNEDYTPSGFLVVNKKRIGNKSFDQDKSGLIQIEDGKITIRDLKKSPIREKEEFEFALQSYPFLIKDSKPALESDSGKRARRSALGINERGNVYLFVVDFPYLSLYEFMNEIIKTGIKFSDVLNLDGGPSTGIYVNTETENLFINSYTKIPSIIRF